MEFDPVTSLTMSVVVLVGLGAVVLHVARRERSRGLLRWSGAGFLCLGAGFALLLAAPTDVQAPVRVIGNAALMLPYGLLWGAARRFDRRTAPFETVVAGALVWLLAASLFDPSQGVRIALTSAIAAAYGAATALEHRRGRDGLPSQRTASWLFAAHGGFFALRALLGPTFGFAPWGPDIAPFWGAIVGVETVTLAVAVAVASIGMSRERTAKQHLEEAMEDPLTGIGNGRALLRSGVALLDACRRAGRPACLLLMNLDGFAPVDDRHGHPAGDRLLVAFARLAHDYLPPTSLVCRIGGEGFAALLPAADLARARAVAEEIRALFGHVVLDDPAGPLRTTVSIGAAQDRGGQGPATQGDLADLVGRADLCLHAARRGGRDRVAAEGDPGAADGAPARRTAA